MTPPQPTTARKTEILDVATDLLRTCSYAGFSYQQLADRLGIRKASIHHHFQTKEELGLALIERTSEFFRTTIGQMEGLPPGEVLRRYFDLAKPVMLGELKVVCPLDAFEGQPDKIPDAIRVAIQAQVEQHETWLGGVLRAGRDSGDVQFLGDPRDQARLIKAVLQGARQVAQLHGADQFDAILGQLRRGMGLA